MHSRNIILAIVILVLFFVWVLALSDYAGNTDPTNPPGATSSYTLEDIYNRLNAGADGSQSTFTEPVAGPGIPTMHTLNDIMGVAPAADNTNGATTAQVLSGKSFWGLRTDGTWGTKTGTAAVGSDVSGPDGDKIFPIPDGFYSGKTATANDADLLAGNIRSGVTIFGVVGKCFKLPATGQITSHAAGDDGAYQLGCLPAVGPCTGSDGCNFNRTSLPWSSSSGTGFTDNGNGTVTDNLTGLIWLENADCFGKKTWSQALSDANGLSSGSCGLTDGSSAGDWRLPNINELRSLIEPDQFNPCLPSGHPFTGVQTYHYWSSTTVATNAYYAWDVGVGGGYVSDYLKDNDFYVWPVRGGQ